MTHRSALVFCAAMVLLAGILRGIGEAQPGRRLESPSNRFLVTITRIKPEALDDWLALQKSAVVPELKKRGIARRTVYASGLFGDAFEFTIVQPLTSFASFDSPDARAEGMGLAVDSRLARELRKCTLSTNSFLSTELPELSNPGENRNAPVIGLLRLRVVPGKMEEYQSLFKAEALPALKKADSRVTVSRRGLGTDGYDLTFETPLAQFADLDAPPPLVRLLGREGAAALTARFNSMATVVENTILIRQADLSF